MTRRLLLHVGLPKTATTSLKFNVLVPWERTGRINFLGVSSRPCQRPFRRVWEQVRHRRLTDGKLNRLRPKVDALLDDDRLNVLSDETISGARMDRTTAEAVLHNLRELFRDAEVTVLVSLRSPVDLVAANYAQMWRLRLRHDPNSDTMDRYLERLQRLDGPHDQPGFIYFRDAWLRALRRHFERVEVLLYEDLRHDPAAWSSRMAGCLEVEPDEFWRLFSAKPHNIGDRTPTGRRSPAFTVREAVKRRLRWRLSPDRYTRWLDRYRRLLGRHPSLERIGLRIADLRLVEPTEHRAPDDDQRRRLQRLLGLRDDYVTREFGVSAEKLARYGYMHPDWRHPREAKQTGTGSCRNPPADSPDGGGA